MGWGFTVLVFFIYHSYYITFLDIRETIRVGLGLELVDFEQSDRFRAAPDLGLESGRLCSRGTAGIVFAPHVVCEMTLLSCPVRTFVACVWFDARVRPHVPREHTLLNRFVQAHGAKMHRLPLILLFRLLLRGRPLPLFLPPAAARPTARRTTARTALSLPHWSTTTIPIGNCDKRLRFLYSIPSLGCHAKTKQILT